MPDTLVLTDHPPTGNGLVAPTGVDLGVDVDRALEAALGVDGWFTRARDRVLAAARSLASSPP